MVVLAQAFGSWLVGQFFDAAHRRPGEQLVGSEQDRALPAAGQADVARTARELRPNGSDEDVEHGGGAGSGLSSAPACRAAQEAAHVPSRAGNRHAAQLALLGDATLTGTGQSSAEALGLSVQRITETLVRNIIEEILARGRAADRWLRWPTSSITTSLTCRPNTPPALTRTAEELAQVTRQPATSAQPVPRELPRRLLTSPALTASSRCCMTCSRLAPVSRTCRPRRQANRSSSSPSTGWAAPANRRWRAGGTLPDSIWPLTCELGSVAAAPYAGAPRARARPGPPR